MTSLKHLKDRISPGPWNFAEEPDGKEDTIIEYSGCPLLTVRGTNDMSCIDEEDEDKIAKECISVAEAARMIPDLLQLCEEMKEALYKIKTKPCLACGCSAGSHAEDGRCPEFFDGQLYGWANTFFIAENAMPEIDSALNKYNELFKD